MFTVSDVALAAAMMRSPSFSRPWSSVTITSFPAAISAIADSTESKGVEAGEDTKDQTATARPGNRLLFLPPQGLPAGQPLGDGRLGPRVFRRVESQRLFEKLLVRHRLLKIVRVGVALPVPEALIGLPALVAQGKRHRLHRLVLQRLLRRPERQLRRR